MIEIKDIKIEDLVQRAFKEGQRRVIIKIMGIVIKSKKSQLNDKFIVESVIQKCTEMRENPDKLGSCLTEKDLGIEKTKP